MALPIDTERFGILEPPVLRRNANSEFPAAPGVVSLVSVSFTMPVVRPGLARRIARRLHWELFTLAERRRWVRWIRRVVLRLGRDSKSVVRRGLALFRSQVGSIESVSSPSLPAPPRSRQSENDVFLDPQAFPEPEVLPPIVTSGLNPGEIRTLLQRRAATAVFRPIGMLANVSAEKEFAPQALVVLHPELAVEFTDAYGPWTSSAAREIAWWARLARINVFTSEHDRRMAIQRYGLRPDRTRVVTGSLVARGLDRPPVVAPGKLPARDLLPQRYILGANSRASQANVLLLFQALQVLLWRGVSLPPLLLVGEAPGRFPNLATTSYEEALDAAGIAANLTPGQNLFLLPPMPEGAQAEVEAKALMTVVTDRWSADACLKIGSAALQRCPVIAVGSPAVGEEWGPSDHAVLLVPPDDPAALADAIQYTLDQPAATAQRVERGYCLARMLSDPRRLGFLQELLEEVAGLHAAAASPIASRAA